MGKKAIIIWETDAPMLNLLPRNELSNVIYGILNNEIDYESLSTEGKMVYEIIKRNETLSKRESDTERQRECRIRKKEQAYQERENKEEYPTENRLNKLVVKTRE